MTALLLTHTKYRLLETFRIPIVVVSVIVLPSLSFTFFALPNLGDDPAAATASTVGLGVFSAMIICLFQFGAGIAEERQLPWDPYSVRSRSARGNVSAVGWSWRSRSRWSRSSR